MRTFSFCWALLLVLQVQPRLTNAFHNKSQTYIIHINHSHKPSSFSNHESWHKHMVKSLSSVCPEDNKALHVYSYTHAMQGFSAKLTPCQLTEVEKSPAHLTTLNESFGQMFTTHTPKFLGLNRSLGIWPTASYGDDVIIGVFDTGIWPESESFNDDGMSNIPLRWRGKCQNGTDFTPTALCNNKLIGAQSFRKGLDAAGISISAGSDFDSPRDFHGHGTHTSSIAGGNFVCGASHFGYAKGVAIGIAPRAHLDMYKVIWFDTPASLVATDILAGMDQAISDGVDVMSISLGLMERQTPLYEDVIAIAAFSAIEKGIVVVCAAGNDGPVAATIYNAAPWIMTVGAGTIDRNFIATLELGNGLKFQGTSYFPSSVSITNTNIYYEFNDPRKSGCSVDLDPSEVKGKIVLCDDSGKLDISDKMYVASHTGAYGAIFLTKDSLCLDPTGYSIPAICVHTRFAKEIKEYSMEDNASVKKMRFVFTKTGRGPAPQVASLSSRGPDPVTPNNVLKPDILAPGFDVLGAVRPDVPVMDVNNYDVVTDYTLYRGTSMAAPHVAGVSALVKAVHRDWSPAAIRSAIMATATVVDNTGTTIQDQDNGLAATPLDFGAGHINPNRAMDPGLIFDLGLQDYIDFLCGLGYSPKQMMSVIRRNRWICNENKTDLNYPSFMASFTNQSTSPFEKHFTRMVTNVGEPESTYRAVLDIPDGMVVKVEPSIIQFTSKYQKQYFVLSLQAVNDTAPKVKKYGYLKWIDEHNHTVSSPIVVTIQ